MESKTDLATAYWDAVSAMDADDVASRFTEQASFHFGNTPPLRGRAAIRRAFVKLFGRVASIVCQPVAKWGAESCMVAEADLVVVFEDGRRLAIPITTVLRSHHGRIQDCRIQFYPEPALESARI